MFDVQQRRMCGQNFEVSHPPCVGQLYNQKNVLNIWSEHNYIYFHTDWYIQLHVSALYIDHRQVVL